MMSNHVLLEEHAVNGSMVDRTVKLYEACGHKLVKVEEDDEITKLTFDDGDKCWLHITIDYEEKRVSAKTEPKQLELFE